jgi:hypothetical protein
MKIEVKINTGGAGMIFVVGFFIILGLVAISPRIAAVYAIAVTGWTGGLVSILMKNHASNKLDVQAASAPNGTVEALNQIKINACKPKVCE